MVFGGLAIAKSASKTDANIELVRKHHEEVWSKGSLAVADKIYSNEIVRHSADQQSTLNVKGGVESSLRLFVAGRVTGNRTLPFSLPYPYMFCSIITRRDLRPGSLIVGMTEFRDIGGQG